MTARVRARLLLLPLVWLPAGLIAWAYVSTHDVARTWRELQAGREVTWPLAPQPRAKLGPFHAAEGLVGELLIVLRPLAAVLLLLAIAVLASRAHHRWRRARATTRWELRLGRDDLANLYRVQEAFEGIVGAISARWYERVWRGPDHLALEVHRLPDLSIRFIVAAPSELEPAIRGPLEDLYPDVELIEVTGRPAWANCVVRLKKRRSFVLSIQTTRNYEHAFSKSLVALLGSDDGEVSVQLVLTPAPGFVHRRARRLLKSRERGLTRREHADQDELGVGSVVEFKELRGALETQHRSLLYFDLRVAGHDATAVRRVAGLFSQLRSENEFTRRQMRARRRPYARRVALALPNPLPGCEQACSRPRSYQRSGSSRAPASSTHASRARP